MPAKIEAIENRGRELTDLLRNPGKLTAAGAIALAVFVSSCGKDNDINLYAQNSPTPHEVESLIPDGKVFPTDGEVEFRADAAVYTASSEVTEETGILAITAFCGNPIDKRDPHNLYADIETIPDEDGNTQTRAVIQAFDACSDDGKLENDELSSLEKT